MVDWPVIFGGKFNVGHSLKNNGSFLSGQNLFQRVPKSTATFAVTPCAVARFGIVRFSGSPKAPVFDKLGDGSCFDRDKLIRAVPSIVFNATLEVVERIEFHPASQDARENASMDTRLLTTPPCSPSAHLSPRF